MTPLSAETGLAGDVIRWTNGWLTAGAAADNNPEVPVTLLTAGGKDPRNLARVSFGTPRVWISTKMAAPTDRADLSAFMEAYATLGVDYRANPLDIRHAFKRKAREHHPDRYPPGSTEQRDANERMAGVNAAYQLIREAPLRHHRISTGARPDEPWTDDELEAAVRRSRRNVATSPGIAVALSALGVVLYLLLLAPLSGWHPAGPVVGFILVWAAYFLAVQTPAGLYIWRIIDLFKLVRFVLLELNRIR